MKRLCDLLDTTNNTIITGIKTDSRLIKKNEMFVCTLGLINKMDYIENAILNGANTIVSREEVLNKVEGINYIVIKNIDKALIDILNKFYDNPLFNKTLIGVTGTDGKTTVSTILKDMLKGATIGTNGMFLNDIKKDLGNTTPSLDNLYECFDIINKNKIENIAMEVSSEAYLTKRIPNLKFDIGVFTNITVDHLDKHKTFNNYFDCKMQMIENSKIVILNRDSEYFEQIIKHNSNYLTYGFKNSDITIKNYQLFVDHTNISFIYKNKEYKVNSPLRGIVNVYNLMAAILVLIIKNYSIEEILKRIFLIKQIPGRMEKVYDADYKIIIDHAHTENATKCILGFLNTVKTNRIITVLGCAGGRYKEKRHNVGREALLNSDIVIFTMDDPRDEDVMSIIKDMIKDNDDLKTEYYCITNRKEAIKKAILLSQKDDIIAILGRGVDEVMHINGKDIIHNDKKVVLDLIQNINK